MDVYCGWVSRWELEPVHACVVPYPCSCPCPCMCVHPRVVQVAAGLLEGLAAGSPQWHAWGEAGYNAAATAAGATGNIGDRDAVSVPCSGATPSCAACSVVVQEGNVGAPPPAPTNWSAWRVFARDRRAPVTPGSFLPLDVRTHGGSTAFGNPGVAVLTLPGLGLGLGLGLGQGLGQQQQLLVVSYFLFGEGAASGEAGSLLFWTPLPSNCTAAAHG